MGITYYFAYKGNFYNGLFWISVLLFGISTLLIILDNKIPQYYKILILFLFGTALYVMRILPSTIHFHFPDELSTFETTKLIYEAGSLDVKAHFEVAKYYPGLELLTVFLKTITNLDIFTTAKILIGIIHSFTLIFIYLLLKNTSSSERIAALGAFIYAISPLYIFFHAVFSYESLGILFVIMLIYIISTKPFLSFKGQSAVFSILILVVLPSLVITHHLSSLMILLFIFILTIYQYTKNKQLISPKWYSTLTSLTATLIFGWMVYVATIAINHLYNNFIKNFYAIFEYSIFGEGKTNIFMTSLSPGLLPGYEFIVDNFVYAPLTLLLSFIGIYFIKKTGNTNAFKHTLIIYGPFLYILSLGLIPTSAQELAIRISGFASIGLSFVIAVSLNGLLNGDTKNKNFYIYVKMFSLFAVVLLLIGGISIGDKPLHRVPDLLSPKLVSGPGSMTTDVFYAAQWVEKEFGRYNKMAGDRTTGVVFRGYTSQDADRWNAWRVFLPSSINSVALNYIKTFDIRYIIVDRRWLVSLSDMGDYFDQKESYKNYYPVYGSTELLPQESLDKFENNNLFYKIYDNGNIRLFKVLL